MTEKLLEVKSLIKNYRLKKNKVVKAVNNISFDIYNGQTYALVGESGCGKSTTARSVIKLEEIDDGEIIFNGVNFSEYKGKSLKKLRKDFQIIFQDPYSSLNPRLKIATILEEPLILHTSLSKNKRKKKIIEILNLVGLDESHLTRYPHEFSGGQRQRIAIARAIILEPKLIVADEPVSALDVSIQSQVLNLLKDLQENLDLTYLFISHDLNVVKYIADVIGIMYLGKLVEEGTPNELFDNPKHPYTKALLSAIPINHPEDKKEVISLEGDIPSPINPPSGCPFRNRCAFAMDICKDEFPNEYKESNKHKVYCHLFK